MLRLLATLAALAIASPAFADDKEKDKPKPNTLTQKEIAEGEIMLFDNHTTVGWKIEGKATVKDGWMILGGSSATTATCTSRMPVGCINLQLEFPKDLQEAKRPRISVTPSEKELIGESAKLWSIARAGEVTQVRISVPAETVVRIGRVSVRPPWKTMLFSGKNLDGWKVNAADPKRMKSKWEVTKAGELSVKNGPGDLVTEKEFDNFVLQLECKTNGKALNSGIFFRCIPGQYQNGYEAQIQNGYKNNDRTKPADFGTGAIYRRVAARKVVANDNEWFTMTVVADGKHFATWVNGYQTVDWTDDRVPDENPRKGFRAKKGPISIQGHDPTTDILFRNIRIAELPAKEK